MANKYGRGHYVSAMQAIETLSKSNATTYGDSKRVVTFALRELLSPRDRVNAILNSCKNEAELNVVEEYMTRCIELRRRDFCPKCKHDDIQGSSTEKGQMICNKCNHEWRSV